MRKFRYWKPGGETGVVTAETPFLAAKQILNVEFPQIVRDSTGQVYTNPYKYVGAETECKIWEDKSE